MPQIRKPLREDLRTLKTSAKEVGELCYQITAIYIIPTWEAKPGWTTASAIRRFLVQDPDISKLRHMFRGAPFDDVELLNQAAMAYDEFYRRVVANYENDKARMNTDVYFGVHFSKSYQMKVGNI